MILGLFQDLHTGSTVFAMEGVGLEPACVVGLGYCLEMVTLLYLGYTIFLEMSSNLIDERGKILLPLGILAIYSIVFFQCITGKAKLPKLECFQKSFSGLKTWKSNDPGFKPSIL